MIVFNNLSFLARLKQNPLKSMSNRVRGGFPPRFLGVTTSTVVRAAKTEELEEVQKYSTCKFIQTQRPIDIDSVAAASHHAYHQESYLTWLFPYLIVFFIIRKNILY